MSGLPDTDSVLRKVPNCSTHAGGSVGGSRKKTEPDFELKADYIEHRFEARAMLPPICDALRNRLFCFHKISDTELPHETDADFKIE